MEKDQERKEFFISYARINLFHKKTTRENKRVITTDYSLPFLAEGLGRG